MTRVRIVVDRRTCTGIGLCEMAAPETFRVDDDGLAEVIGDGAAADDIAEAANNCPTRSIRVSNPDYRV